MISRKLFSTLAIAAALVQAEGVAQTPASHIPRTQLEEMFTAIKRDTNWDMSRDMLWGYFFVDKNRDDLEKASRLLAGMGYRVVDIHRDDAQSNWWLHVEKIETHSVQTLDTRNAELDAFAAAHGIEYDGMDVGPAQNHPRQT